MPRFGLLVGVVGFLAISFNAASSQAAVITFDGTTDNELAFTTPYSEAGYTLTPLIPNTVVMFFNDAAAKAGVFPGEATFSGDVLEFNDTIAGFTLTKNGGGLFDLLGVRTGSLGRFASDDGNFIFTGHLFGGGTISTTLSALSTPQQFSFVGFTSLISVTVTTSDGFFPVMDNLEVTASTDPAPVPEPATLSLLALGLAGCGVARRKKGQRVTTDTAA